jgi:hypothetical protein
VWSRSSARWHVGLSAHRLARVTLAGALQQRIGSYQDQPCATDAGAPAWRAATGELMRLLEASPTRVRAVRVVLSGCFVRWQLLPWHPELNRQEEVAAHARLRFGEVYGALAGEWTVLHAPQPPGRAVPACAVDTALVQLLRTMCKDAGAQLELVAPYFACAAQHWRSTLGEQSAWFAVVEPDWVSLGLLHQGAWVGLHARQVDADWAALLPGMMAQLALGAGVAESAWPVYLVGAGDASGSAAAMPWVRLHPSIVTPGDNTGCRMALGL